MEFLIITLIKTFIVFAVLMTTLAYLQWVERKLLAHIQLRLGPSRVGPHGLLQPLADVIKLATKEGVIPPHVNKFFYVLAPPLGVMLSLVPIAVIPFGPQIEVLGFRTNMELTDLNIGLLFILAVSSLGVYAISLGGWASNNKYSLLGGLRSAAQMISYELPMAIALVSAVLMLNSLSLREIVDRQSGYYLGFIPRWSIFMLPFPQIISFAVYLISAFAETNRIPFDLPEAENELVSGYHTEYSSMKFASFFMAEYANMITVCAIATLLFLGGWQPLFPSRFGSNFIPTFLFLGGAAMLFYHGLNYARPFDRITMPVFGCVFGGVSLLFLAPVVRDILQPFFWFAAKTGVLLFLFIWVRGTLPRFRYDQLMKFTWTFLFPVAVANMLVTALAIAVFAK
jgi:NADH-quinone oxidoreductase subunit H